MDHLDHDIVQDLLPLYHDGVCSEKSRAAVEEHLKACETCRAALAAMDAPLPGAKREVAADDAAAVQKISEEWKKSKRKARLKGAAIAAAVCAVLVFLGLVATQWPGFPVDPAKIEITNVRQLSDGRILYHFYIDDDLGLRSIYFEFNEEGNAYYVPRRALITEKRIPHSPNSADMDMILDMREMQDDAQANGISAEITAVWYGTGVDRVLLWMEGMDLPAASAADEAEWGFDASSAAYWEAHDGPLEAAP